MSDLLSSDNYSVIQDNEHNDGYFVVTVVDVSAIWLNMHNNNLAVT
jgi:hypothetical protein